jgi:hypothetical protein
MTTEVKISELPAASSAVGTMQFEANDSGTSKRVTLAQTRDNPLFTGLVGIGAASGGEQLRVYAASLAQQKLTSDNTTLQAFASTSTAGVGTDTNHPLLFSTNGSEKARIAAGGNVGIGTNDPQRPLDVNGSIRAASGSSVEFGGTSNYVTGNSSTNFLALHTNANERVRIDSSGNLGIGTNAPTGKLHVTDASYAYCVIEGSTGGNISFFKGTTEGYIGTWVDNTLLLGAGKSTGVGVIVFETSNGTERVRINGSGNVGVATASPAARLDVNGNVAQNIVAVSALDIDCSAGNYFTKTISASSAFTFSNAPSSRAYSFTLELTVSTGGAATWPTTVKWPGDTAPTLDAGKTQLLMFVTDDGGTRWRGAALANYVN